MLELKKYVEGSIRFNEIGFEPFISKGTEKTAAFYSHVCQEAVEWLNGRPFRPYSDPDKQYAVAVLYNGLKKLEADDVALLPIIEKLNLSGLKQALSKEFNVKLSFKAKLPPFVRDALGLK